MSGLVTGEAVALGLDPAKLPSRALAMTIDLVVYWAGFIGLMFLLAAATSSLDGAAVAAVSVGALLLVLVGVPIAIETLTQGRSLGKLACGLRVVRDDGGPIRFRHALVRGAVGVVEIQLSMGVIACVASLVSARGRRLGDLFAGTLVIRERVPVQGTRMMTPPPPWLTGQLAGTDLSAVPEGLWLAVRQYLSRIHQLDPQVSWSMGQRLAADIASCTGARPPEGAPPAAFLAAVVAERQSRDAHRVFGTGTRTGPVSSPAPAPAPRPAALLYPAQAGEARTADTAHTADTARTADASDSASTAHTAAGPGTGFVPPA